MVLNSQYAPSSPVGGGGAFLLAFLLLPGAAIPLDEIHDQTRELFDYVPVLLRAERRVMSGDIGWF
jgi:hypothetical protein